MSESSFNTFATGASEGNADVGVGSRVFQKQAVDTILFGMLHRLYYNLVRRRMPRCAAESSRP